MKAQFVFAAKKARGCARKVRLWPISRRPITNRLLTDENKRLR